MKKSLKLLSILVLLSTIFAFASPEKKLNKLVAKVWNDQTVSLERIQLPDTLQSMIKQLNEVKIEGELVGFACYTSAFGCRVGGCAAPGNPNAQAYESFDYMVIYDSKMNILAVEIAEYTGQYGYEICRAKWLAQFNGGSSGFKLYDNVDGISGATISATYLIEALNTLGITLKDLRARNVI